MTASEDNKAIIGWREWVALPDLKIPAIKAKIDTGARTSALHAFDIEVFKVKNRKKVRFGIHPMQKNTSIVCYCEADVKEQRMVKDSGGHSEQRYIIHTTLSWANKLWPIEVNLTRRDNMKFRILLGRSALQGRFLIDLDRSYLAGRYLAKAYRRLKTGGRKH
ncbi:MAG: ATP-dependent zinc protease [Desulfobacterales bacterium]|nr:ATP-dependent zinc protease [Desulfobacterales bacterium]